jgi:hypothetical protein
MKKVHINEQVAITAIGFRKNLAAYPRRMEFRGNTYYFVDAGLRCQIRRGSCIAEIVILSDGRADYHLRTDDHGGNWTLLSITSC